MPDYVEVIGLREPWQGIPREQRCGLAHNVVAALQRASAPHVREMPLAQWLETLGVHLGAESDDPMAVLRALERNGDIKIVVHRPAGEAGG